MAKRFSTGLRTALLADKGVTEALDNGIIIFFDGTQPATADDAYNTNGATPLVAFTEAGVAIGAGATFANRLSVVAGAKDATIWSGTAGSSNMNSALATIIASVAGGGFSGFTTGERIATWFRYYSTVTDAELGGTPTTSTTNIRFDGSVGSSSAFDMISSGGTTIAFGSIQTIPTFSFSVPAQQA